jgi:tRNA (cytidine/uridine-2'-O-)-methyltransferase
MRLALYQPDIPPNVGAMMRLIACLGVPLDVIEPCGFPFGEKSMRRAALDYGASAEVIRHRSWQQFLDQERNQGRIVLLSTKAAIRYTDFTFRPDDTLMMGRETSGVPDRVWQRTDAQVTVSMVSGMRSLNVATAAAIVLSEALRQTGLLPVVEADKIRHMGTP